MKIFSCHQMSEAVLTLLVFVLLLKELGVLQALRKALFESNEDDKEKADDEDIEEETSVHDETSDEVIDVEEASEEVFEDEEKVEDSDKDEKVEDKPITSKETKQKKTFFDAMDPEKVSRIFMKKQCSMPKPDPNKPKDSHVIIFDYKPMERDKKTVPSIFNLDEYINRAHLPLPIVANRKIVKNNYPRITFIGENIAKLEESPNEEFYCTSSDMPKIKLMSKEEQLKQLRMKKTHMAPIDMSDDDLFESFDL